jgi:hypothetical protein
VTTKKKPTAPSKGAASDVTPDPRAPLPPSEAAFRDTLAALDAVLVRLPPPAEPKPSDLVDAMLHIVLTDQRPCGVGQEALRRIQGEFVDRNEFRVTEAFEVEQLLADLMIPDLFTRCTDLQRAVGLIYNDRNDVNLDFLRESAIADRNAFLQRVSVPQRAVRFIGQVIDWEEVLFSDRSTQRVQARLGLEGGAAGLDAFLRGARDRLRPYGGIPMAVGPHPTGGTALLEPTLCPTCLLCRIAPLKGKK